MNSTLPAILLRVACFAMMVLLPASKLGAALPTPNTATSPEPVAPPAAPAQRSAAELEKLAQAIALHPDPLIAIMLPAAVYPVEIVQAARFVKDTNNIPKVDEQNWDDNVKAVAKIPALIAQMDADLDWTVRLGQAFLDQPKELMDTIQALRAKAQQGGTLQTTPQQIVTVTNMVVEKTIETQVVVVTNTVVQIQPANPQVVYVPSYPPTVYYPPPSYVYDPYAPLVTFGVGMAVGAIIANNCDWHGGGVYVGHHGAVVWGGGGYHGDVDIDINNNVNIDRNRTTNTSADRMAKTGTSPPGQKWQPDQSRLRNSGTAATSAGTMEARGWGSGGATGSAGARPSTGAAGARPSTGAGSVRPGAGGIGTGPSTGGARPSTGAVGARPSAGAPSVSRPSAPGASRPSASPAPAARPASSPSFGASGGSAFSGVSSGSSSREFSNRGAASRSGGFSSAGGRTGGGGGRASRARR